MLPYLMETCLSQGAAKQSRGGLGVWGVPQAGLGPSAHSAWLLPTWAPQHMPSALITNSLATHAPTTEERYMSQLHSQQTALPHMHSEQKNVTHPVAPTSKDCYTSQNTCHLRTTTSFATHPFFDGKFQRQSKSH